MASNPARSKAKSKKRQETWGDWHDVQVIGFLRNELDLALAAMRIHGVPFRGSGLFRFERGGAQLVAKPPRYPRGLFRPKAYGGGRTKIMRGALDVGLSDGRAEGGGKGRY